MQVVGYRSTSDVFEDHVRLRLAGNLEEDLRRNYANDVLLLTINSNARGHDAIRLSARRLEEQLPQAKFQIAKMQVEGPHALLVWSATSAEYSAVEGADTFFIENGKIQFQSIHYGLLSRVPPMLVTRDGNAR